MPSKPRHHNTHLPRLQPLASALLAICIGVPSAQAVANTAVDLGLNQRHTAKAARSTPKTNQRQHRSAPHLGGWRIGVLSGINWLDTGQAGSDNQINFEEHFSYHHYRHGIWGVTTGYELPATHNLLWGVELAYKELGSAQMDVRNNAGTRREHYDTDSVKASSLLFSARYYLQDHFSVVAKLGGALQRSRFSHRVTGGQGPMSGSNDGFIAREVRTALNPEWQIGLSQDWGAWRASLLLDRIAGQAPGLSVIATPVTNPSSMALLASVDYRLSDSALPQHRSAPHLGGWRIGVLSGINWLDTGQAGNVASDNSAGGQEHFSYHHYRHGIWGVTTGYELPATRHLLWGVELAYKELGSAQMDVHDNNGAKDHYDTDSVKASSLLFSARYYLQDQFSVVAKLGGALQRSRFSHRVTGGTGPLSLSNNGFTAREVRTALNPEWQIGLSQDWGTWRASLLLDRITGQAPGLGRSAAPVTNPSSMALLAGIDYHLSNSALPQHRSAPHLGGWRLGVLSGINWLDTGQAGNVASRDAGIEDHFSYHHYRHGIWGVTTGYELPATRHLLWGVELAYKELGSAKMDVRDGIVPDTARDHYDTDSVKASSLLFSARYYLQDHFSVVAKLGGALQRSRFIHRVTVDEGPLSFSTDGFTAREVRTALNPEWQLGLSQDWGAWRASLLLDRITGQAPGLSDTAAPVTNPSSMAILAGVDYRLSNSALPQHRSAPHLGGWRIGVLSGINWLDTGQAGNVASDNRTGDEDHFSYHHYRHGIWGVTTGYELPATRHLLWGVELAYKELGSAKMDVRDNIRPDTAKDHYDTDSVKASSLLFSARYYLQDHFSVVAKLGGALQRSRFSHRVTGGTGPLSNLTNGFIAREVRTALNPEWQIGLSQDWGAWRVSLLLDRITGQAPGLSLFAAPVTNPSSMAGLLVLSYRFTSSQ